MVAINILGDINDNINKKLVIDNIKLVSSVYTLKQAINNELELSSLQNKNEYFLSYNGIKLNDDKPLIEYGIKDNSDIALHYNLNGGKSKSLTSLITGFISDYILYIIFIFIFFVYLFLLASGFIALLAKLYGYSTSILVKYILGLIYSFFGKKIDDSNNILNVVNLIHYIFKYLSLALLIFISTYYVVYLLYYTFTSKSEKKSVLYSWSIARGVTFVFLFFYLLYRIPDIIVEMTIPLVDRLKKPYSFIRTPLILGKKSFDDIKYLPIYFIFGFYFMFLNESSKAYKELKLNLTNNNGKLYECPKDNDIDSMLNNMINNTTNKKVNRNNEKININNITNKVIKKQKALIIKKYFDQLLIMLNIDKNDPIDQIYIKISEYLFCNALKIFSIFDKAMISIGSTETIQDIIMSSSVSGFFSIISLIIALIVYMLFY